MTSREVCLDGGSPWGFRMHGGVDVNQPLRISRVNPGSKAALRGIREGDLITSINGQSTKDISNAEAHNLLRNAGEILKLGLNEDISGSPKRRQYRTVHQETHSETIKRSTVTTYSIKSSKTTEDIETTQDDLKENSDSKICPLNNITSQRSTLSTNCSSSPSTLSDLAGNFKSSSHETNILERSPPPYNTNPTSSPSSIITEVGVWSPGQKPEPIKRPEELIEHPKQTPEDESSPQPPVWTPKSANSSPTVERKEFRPVNFQSPKLERKQFTKTTPNGDNNTNLIGKSIEPPWKFDDNSQIIGQALEKRLTSSQSSPASGFSDISPSPRLPKAQNPTITLLQKAREGQLPKGAHYLDQQSHFERRFPNERPALANPGDVLVYKIKNEYTSESDSERPRKMADLGPRKYDGIGPTTKNGMPLTLRSEVKDANQSKWYKRMYDTIHKPKLNKDEYVTVRYKQRRALYPYTSGYLSEPEPGAYDSDYTDYKYATLDRRRQPLTERSNEYLTNAAATASCSSSTMPRNLPNKSSSSSDIVRNSQGIYKNQPGRIENYMPGHSSISEKEAKEWWDEVMDIFDGMEQQKRVPQTKSFINQALKESGYESDSTLIFRRKEEAAQQLSPSEQKEAYKAIQKGGDVPLHGLRKPAPERPKDEQIEYFPISPTLTRIRIHKNNIQPQREILCYPVTVHYNNSNKFRDYKRTAPSSININEATATTSTPPPSPPKRKSSRNNSTLRLISTMKVKTSNEKSPLCKRHETCFTTTSNVDKTKVKYLRDKLTCKLTTKKKTDSPKIKVFKTITTAPNVKSKIITSTLTTTKSPNTFCRKVQSKTNIKSTETSKVKSSLTKKTPKPNESTNKPTTSRLNSPLRTFGSEKRKCELSLTKTSVSPRRKLTKTPDLLSPIQVKKAVENTTNGIVYKKSNILTKNGASVPIKVGISDKGRSIIKPTIRSASLSPKLTKKRFTSSQSSLSNRTKSSLESLNSPKLSRKTPRELIVEPKKLQKPKKDKINVEIRKTKREERPVEIVKNPTLENIQKQKQVIETNHFFRNLFLRNLSPPPSSPSSSRSSWLIEKTQQLNIRRRSSITEPSIGAMKVYLKHIRPVSDSKFLSLDLARSRSASPKSVTWHEPCEKPAKQRSSSLPSKIIFSQTSRPISPAIYHRSPSPSICRSPSSRRITQCRNENKIEKRAPLSIYMCPNLNQSTSSLESFENHEYQTYIKELLHSSRKCDKFQDLNHFYADIEKVGQLEQRFNVKPRKKCENQIVDYDRWQEVRLRERAEQQLNNLYTQLKQNEKDKGFLFTPIDVNRQKWRRELDRGLRIKEKSVENIKDEFEKLKEYDWNLNRRDFVYNKDTYKPLWRGNSVVNLAQILTERRSQSEGRLPSSTPLKYRQMDDDDKLLTRRIGSRIWSSLSMEQVNLLKEQLTEIYSGNLSKETKNNNTNCSIHVSGNNKEKYSTNLIVRRNSDTDVCNKNQTALSESDKKLLSNSLSKEVIDKLMKKRENTIVGKEILGAVASQNAKLKEFNNEDVKPKQALIKLDVTTSSPNKSTSETESGSTDESTKTVIYVPKEEIKKKVEYFEKTHEFVPTIYKPAENDEENSSNHLIRSESCQNIKEYFGEHDLHKFATIPLSATKREQCNTLPTKPQLRALSPIKTASSISEATSYDSLCRSRSISPYLNDNTIYRGCFNGGGEVQRLKHKFEDYHNELFRPRRSKSDSDLNKYYNKMYHYGYVDDLRRKYEYPALAGRGRSRQRRGGVVSPIFLRAEDRFMPHINIISKIARLYNRKTVDDTIKNEKNIKELAKLFDCPVGVVEKLIEKYENAQNISLVGQMYTSSPNLKEIRDISPYLQASWTAHRYPKSEDNTRSLSQPEKSIGSRDTSLVCRRSKSISPIRTILKHKQEKNTRNDVKKRQDEAVRYKTWLAATNSRPSVSFKGVVY